MSNPPRLYCPFPKVHPHPQAEALVAHALDWARSFGLLPDNSPETLAKVRSYSLLAASCYPLAPFERLAAICDYYSWLFFFDDTCEDLSIDGATPERVAALMDGVYTPSGAADAVAHGAQRFSVALQDIRRRIIPACPPELRTRLDRHIANYIDACIWEAQNRGLTRVPSRAVFQAMRMFTSTMYQFWDFIEFAGDFCLPQHVVEHPVLAELQRAGNAVASYANDIFSLRKEEQNRDFHNLVVVLQHEESLTSSAAFERAAALHDAQVRHFNMLERLVPSFGLDIDRDVAKYVQGMRTWMRANYDWSTVTPRYRELRTVEKAASP